MNSNFHFSIPDDSPFGLHNLPLGVFSVPTEADRGEQRRVGTAIGDYVLDLDVLEKYGVFKSTTFGPSFDGVFANSSLNRFAACPAANQRFIRETLIELLSDETSVLFQDSKLRERAFVPRERTHMHNPFATTDFTDFGCSIVHLQNATRSFKVPFPAAFFEYPMGYNGRVSSIQVSGTEVTRPSGFYQSEGEEHPVYRPSKALDFEIELGVFISAPVEAGEIVDAQQAADNIFGYVLLNDWSARDIQRYEMNLSGMFHSKSFLTSISPWVVTPEALSGAALTSPPASNSSMHLSQMLRSDKVHHGLYDITFSATVSRNNGEPIELARTNMKHAFWTHPQMIAYQSSSGCGINTGDLLGSGTLSSPDEEETRRDIDQACMTWGCLAEAFACSKALPEVGGQPYKWIEDGDTLTIEAWFKMPDGKRAGFGGVSGTILPAKYPRAEGIMPEDDGSS